jgi:uncharacterized protein (TIGR03437 family)
MKYAFPFALMGVSCAAAFGQGENRVTLVVDVANTVSYRSDVIDPNGRGTAATQTAPPPNRPFTDILNVGDIVAVNGTPARGLWTSRIFAMGFSPTPAPGFGIADRASGNLADCKWEFLDADGRLIGAIFDSGYFPHGVTAGTGAFYGARGQMGSPAPANAPPLPPQRPIRIASTSEDPGRRRVLGGGTSRVIFTLIPAERPEVMGAYHQDFSPVTAANPARPDEVILLRASGLGSLVPGNLPSGSEPFPDPPVEVNSPVSATVAGQAAEVTNKVGWPGSTSTYRVDVRIPAIPAGETSLQLTVAWIPGPVFRLPIGNLN